MRQQQQRGDLDALLAMFVAVVLLVVLAAAVSAAALEGAAMLEGKRWAHIPDLEAALHPYVDPAHPAAPVSGGAGTGVLGAVLFWVLAALELGLLIAAGVTVAARLVGGRRGPGRAIAAPGKEVAGRFGARAVRRRAGVLRPGLRSARGSRVDPADVGLYLGERAHGGRAVWATREDSVLMVAPPRSGKSLRWLVPMLRRARGPQVVVSSRDDLLRHTAFVEEWRGRPLWVVDLGGVIGVDGRARRPHAVARAVLDIVAPCRAPAMADLVADALVGVSSSTRTESSLDDEWGHKAKELLRAILHAAALEGLAADWVARTVATDDLDSVARILRRHPQAAPGWADVVAGMAALVPETRGGIVFTASAAIHGLTLPEAVAATVPDAARPLVDVDALLDGSGRLFLLGRSEQRQSFAGLATAMVEMVVALAKERAARTATGRLDPPLLLAIDEMYELCPLRTAPSLMASGGGRGITPVFVWQDLDLMRAAYGGAAAGGIVGAATAHLILGGLRNDADLRRLSALTPEVIDEQRTRSYSGAGMAADSASVSVAEHRRQAWSVHDLHTLREGEALLLARGMSRPVRLRVRGHWESRRDKVAVEHDVAVYDAAVAAAASGQRSPRASVDGTPRSAATT